MSAPAGFTLVEMLVSAALVVLVMLMFAEVYRVAGDSVGRQKGIVENDQRSRTLTTIIKSDIDTRTFRNVLPIHPTLEPTPIPNVSERTGYFSISENDPLDDTDDVLSLTVSLGADDAPLTGHAIKFDQPPLSLGPPNDNASNQPEADDGQIDFVGGVNTVRQDSTGASRFAEISYWLRNGNLFRRVVLIRAPYDGGAAQPPAFPANDYPAAPPGPFPSSFWNDFDYSAFFLAGSGPQFHSTLTGAGGDLDNDDLSSPTSFGIPPFRFGHDHVTGNPREYVNLPVALPLSQRFIGRFTQQETSHPEFGYPGRIPDLDGDAAFDNSPLDTATPTNLGIFNGVVSFQAGGDGNFGTSDDVQFTGARRGEDILMTHVHSFDVKVFDEVYNEDADNDGVLDLGEDLNRNGRLDVSEDADKDGVLDAGEDVNLNGVPDGGAFADVGYAPSASGDYAQANNRHIAAPLVRPYGPHPALADNRIFDTWHHLLDIDDADGGAPGGEDPPPFWPNSDGNIANAASGNPIVGRPLKAIQITIRFFDVASGQMRQLTLVESLVD